jgi:hypothetical protein
MAGILVDFFGNNTGGLKNNSKNENTNKIKLHNFFMYIINK